MPATVVSALTSITQTLDSTGFSVWKRDGTGGTPSAVDEGDAYEWGVGAASVKVSNQGVVLAFGTGGLNLSAAGIHVYLWALSLVGSLMATRANNGLCIFLSSDATLSSGSNYKMWAVDGSDTYPGGAVRYVMDLSKQATVSVGTLNLADVRWIGFYCDTRPNVAKFDNLILGPIDYGTDHALRVYGTSTTDDLFTDVLAGDDTGGAGGRKVGALSEKEGILYARAGIDLGDDIGTNSADLTDIDKVIVYENPVYYDGASVESALASGFSGLHIVGNATGTTTVQFGKKVGTGDDATGRNGLTIIGRGPGVSFEMSNPDNDSVKIYGSKFEGITGMFEGSNNAAHEFIGNQITNCGQFDPVGAIVIRDLNLVGYAGATGGLLWNANIDIKKARFIANTDGTNDPAAIMVPAAIAGPITADGLQFSGNDFDIRWGATSGTLQVDATGGSNPSTWAAGGTADVDIQNAVTLTIEGCFVGKPLYVIRTDTQAVLIDRICTATTETASFNYPGSDVPVEIRHRVSSTGDSKKKRYTNTDTIRSTGLFHTINMFDDNLAS